MKKIIFLIISIVFITTACEDDIFDRQPLDKISDSDVWNNPVMLRSYLTDVYNRMYFTNQLRAGNTDRFTDLGSYHHGNMNTVTQGSMSRTNDPIGFWNWSLIRDVNIFLERIGDADLLESVKNQMEGEARVLRAMIYFEKQKRYGGVPLVDVSLDPFGEIDEKYTTRSSEEAIADFINSDLERAIEVLGASPSPVGQINKWTAHAVKARANLWSASIAKYGSVELNGLVGIPSARANEFYGEASAAANAVIQSGHYELFDIGGDRTENYRQLFITPDNGEEIFSVIYDGVNRTNSYKYHTLPQSIAGGRGSTEALSYDWILLAENIDGSPDQPLLGPDHVYDDMQEAFGNKDPRIHASTYFDGDVYEGHTIRTYEAIDPNQVPDPDNLLSSYGSDYQGMPQVAEDSRAIPFDDKRTATGLIIKKWQKGTGSEPNDVNWMEYRLAEMYLTRAEAEFELGNPGPAATALNATRARAGISLVDENTITLDHIRTERSIELTIEFHRWWDLRRWRTAEEVLNLKDVLGLQIIYHYDSGGIYMLPVKAEPITRIFLPHHYYNPITDGRIDDNVDLVENPGY